MLDPIPPNPLSVAFSKIGQVRGSDDWTSHNEWIKLAIHSFDKAIATTSQWFPETIRDHPVHEFMNPTELPDHWESLRKSIAFRIRELRTELYGEHGGPILANELDLPFRRWMIYERGEPMPADVMLRFLTLTRADPHWLLTGAGPKYRDRP